MAIVVTGAKAFIRISGEYLAFASGVSVSHENRLEEIAQLDSLEVAEYAENGHRCTVTINTIKLAADASIGGTGVSNSGHDYGLDFDINKHNYQKVGASGALPKSSLSKDTPANFKKLQSGDINQILLQPEMIIEIVESVDVKDANGRLVDVTDALVYLAEGAKFEGGSGQLDSRGFWQGSWTFKCRRGTGI